MAKNQSSVILALFFLVAAAMTAPQRASARLIGESLFRCWEAVSAIEDCVDKVPAAEAVNIHLKLTPQCCNAVQELGEKCLSTIYPDFSFAPKLGSLFQRICGDNVNPAPQPLPFIN